MALSDADLQKVADQLFLLKQVAPTKLVAPANTPALATKLEPVVAANEFKNLGIAVVNFSADPANPTTYLHNGDRRTSPPRELLPWRLLPRDSWVARWFRAS